LRQPDTSIAFPFASPFKDACDARDLKIVRAYLDKRKSTSHEFYRCGTPPLAAPSWQVATIPRRPTVQKRTPKRNGLLCRARDNQQATGSIANFDTFASAGKKYWRSARQDAPFRF